MQRPLLGHSPGDHPRRPLAVAPQEAGRPASHPRELDEAEAEHALAVKDRRPARVESPASFAFDRSCQRVDVGVGPPGPEGSAGLDVRTLDVADSGLGRLLRPVPKKTPPHAAAHRGQQVEDGVGAVLARPLLDDLPRGRDKVDEERVGVPPLPAPAPVQAAGNSDQTRDQRLDYPPCDERVLRGAAQHGSEDAGRVDASVLEGCLGRSGAPESGSRQPRDELAQVFGIDSGDVRLSGCKGGQGGARGGEAALGSPVRSEPVDWSKQVSRHASSVCAHPPTGSPDRLPPVLPPVPCGVVPGPSAVALQCAVVDIEEFYDADSRRRSSTEVELGGQWRDEQGVRFELSWVEDTGELYVMREPAPEGWATPFGGIHVRHGRGADEKEIAAMTVVVVGSVPSRERLDEVLAGWQEAMTADDSVEWLVDRLRSEHVLVEGTSVETI